MKSISYSDAGVSIDAANIAKEKIKQLARTTFNARTLSEIGSFGGMFDGTFPNLKQPVLVASADGVGTKLKVAFLTNTHNTIGRENLVNLSAVARYIAELANLPLRNDQPYVGRSAKETQRYDEGTVGRAPESWKVSNRKQQFKRTA